MLQTVFAVTAVVIVLAALWAAREAVMLIYVSALIAMGFAPLVSGIERRNRAGSRRVPRVLAILLIYITIIAVLVVVGFIVFPPLVEQATALWASLPRYFTTFTRFLRRYGLTSHTISFQEAVQNAPAGAGGSAVTTV